MTTIPDIIDFSSSPIGLPSRSSLIEICNACNELALRSELDFSPEDILFLETRRLGALQETDRVEFESKTIVRLVETFCNSPFLDRRNYRKVLSGLMDLFYRFKEESQDRFSDEATLALMQKLFDTKANGSLVHLEAVLDEFLEEDGHDGC